jgi:D-alanine--D-alanine ligase
MHKMRVAVLRGGPSREYEASLRTGESVLKHIPDDSYHVHDIFIDREGTWHKNGLSITPHVALSHADVIWNALQGAHEHNRQVEHLLEMHQVPFTGPGAFASGISLNPLLLKEIFKREKIKTPQYIVVDTSPQDMPAGTLATLWKTYSPPLIIRPIIKGESAVIVARTFDSFAEALEAAFDTAESVMIEEYIPGTAIPAGVIDEYRGIVRYTLPLLDPGLSSDEKEELEALARRVHDLLGLRHYSEVQLLRTPRRGTYVTGVIASPELHEESHFHKALGTVGAPLSHFIDHVLQLALAGK